MNIIDVIALVTGVASVAWAITVLFLTLVLLERRK